MLGRFFFLGEEFAVIVSPAIHRVDRIREDKLVLFGFMFLDSGGILQRAQFCLKLGIGFDDGLERFANVVLATGVRINVVVKFVVEGQELFELVMGLLAAVSALGIATHLFE